MPAVIHYLQSTGHEDQLTLVPVKGEFNWLFICAITLLSIKWATIDQAILQRAFGARSPRIGAQGMVLSAIVTTPFAFFWILPGLATARLKPGFANPDHAIPWLLSHELPAVARGLLGMVLCGLVAAQISTITADVNSVATLFTSDVYRILRRREPSQRQLLVVVRLSSLVCGAVMLMAAWFLRESGDGAVKANLTVVGILDMPLFVVTIVYGLLWRRANWQGAIAGFLAGGTVGVLTHFLVTPKYFDAYLHPVTAAISGHLGSMIDNWHNHLKVHEKDVRNIVPILSSLTALVVTAAVSLLTTRSRRDVDHIWDNFNVAASVGGESDTFHLIPITFRGRLGMIMAVGGFVVFLIGILSAALAVHFAGAVAVVGMFTVLAGGLLRVYSE
jgi:SSS family solute:Na+ symporter